MRQLRLILVPNFPPTVGLSDFVCVGLSDFVCQALSMGSCRRILVHNPDEKILAVKGFGTFSKS